MSKSPTNPPSSVDAAQSSNQTTSPSATPSTTQVNSTATSKASSKPKQKRSRKPIRRRGAKPAADEGEEEESKPSAVGGGGGDDSESDFDPDSGREDNAESEEEEEEEENEPEATKSENPHTNGSSSTAPATQFDQAQKVTPAAWSDMPAEGEAGSSQLPELDFAGLSVSKLDALPEGTVNGDKPKSKKEILLQKKLEKSEELRKKDPEAWEKQEKERKEREEVKRLARKEKQKEKNKARKAAKKEQRESEEKANGTEAATPSTSTSRPAPVPARPSKTAVALGLANSTDSPPAASTSRQQPAFTSNSAKPNPAPSSRFPRPPPSGAPHVDYNRAREAYTERLASDPAYIPKVGKFWGHDDRLASPEVRPLNPFWRGGRGGAGSRGRGGAMRGSRGGFPAQRGPDRWTADGKVSGEGESEIVEKENEKAQGQEETREAEKPKELDPEDKWGRGESKRAQKPSEFASMPGWNHAGFEELEREDEERAARGPSPSVRGAKRGARGGAARGGRGGFAGRGGLNQGPPGSINPRYAHLPFHPLHRFPPSTLPAAQNATSSTASEPQPSTEEASPATESVTTVESNSAPQVASPSRPGTVRLPSSGVAAAQFALAVKEATSSRPAPEESIPEPVKAEVQPVPQPQTAVPAPNMQQPPATSPSLELRKQQGASILYAADPSRLANSVPREDAVSPASSFSAYQQQMEPTPIAHNPYQHQLPPHLQSQAAFIPRHSSPSFYPNGPPPPSFYPIDSYGSMPSPSSATPPPQHFSSPPTSSFFLPPRSSRVEIKNPSSPAPSRQTVVSTNNTAYAIASQQHPSSPSVSNQLPPTFHHQNPYSASPYGYPQSQNYQPTSFSPQQHYEMPPAHYYQQFQQPPPPQPYSYYPQHAQQQYAPY